MRYSVKTGVLPKQVSAYDIDGTIVNTSFVMEHFQYLVEKQIVPKSELLEQWKLDKKNDKLIKDTANEYKERVMVLKNSVRERTVNDMLLSFPKEKFVDETLELIKHDIDNKILPILISGSPKYIVKPFARFLSRMFTKQKTRIKGYGSIYANEGIIPMWDSDSKRSFVKKYLSNVEIIKGVGDSYADIPLLERAKHKYMIHPNAEAEKMSVELFGDDLTIVR